MTTIPTTQEVTYVDAISQALDEEMSQDERVFHGEDIGLYGGASKGDGRFPEKYGEWRAGYPAFGIRLRRRGDRRSHDGVASGGRDAVCGFYFLRLRSDHRSRRKESLPMGRGGALWSSEHRSAAGSTAARSTRNVLRAGFSIRQGSRSWPYPPYDAKGYSRPRFVINLVPYFEHKFLYRRIKAVLPQEEFVVPLGRPRSNATA